LIGILGGVGAAATIIGLVPGIGDVAQKAIMSGARSVADSASYLGKGALDLAQRVEVDPNAMGAFGGNIKLKPRADIEQIRRSNEGYGALGNLAKPTKVQLDPAGLGATKLPDFAENIEYTTTDKGLLVPKKEFSFEDNMGRTLTPAYGDRTYADKILNQIQGPDGSLITLDQPVNMQGGSNFMRSPDGVWASEQQAMNAKAKAMGKMDDPIMAYTAMSGQAGDASKMMSDATIGMVEQSPITKKAAKAYDERIREDLDPNWVGIQSPNVREYLSKMPMTIRRELWQEMDKKNYKDQGFPDLGVIRASITEPDMLTSPSFTTGRSFGALDSVNTSPSKHETYNTKVQGTYEGGLDQPVPGDIIWRDFFEDMAQRKINTGKSNPQRAFLMTPSIQQKVDQQMVDEIGAFTEMLKDRK